jgi:hypothetical protein
MPRALSSFRFSIGVKSDRGSATRPGCCQSQRGTAQVTLGTTASDCYGRQGSTCDQSDQGDRGSWELVGSGSAVRSDFIVSRSSCRQPFGNPKPSRRSPAASCRYTCPPREPLAQLGERRLCTACPTRTLPLKTQESATHGSAVCSHVCNPDGWLAVRASVASVSSVACRRRLRSPDR